MTTRFLTTIAAAVSSLFLALPAQADPQADANCAPQAMSVYFPEQSADVTPEAQAVVSAVAEQLDTCQIVAVTLRVPAIENQQSDLSAARRDAVLAVLTDKGLNTANFSANTHAVARRDAAMPAGRAVQVALITAPVPIS